MSLECEKRSQLVTNARVFSKQRANEQPVSNGCWTHTLRTDVDDYSNFFSVFFWYLCNTFQKKQSVPNLWYHYIVFLPPM